MSYILDALKKADQERTIGEVPDLEVAHWGERRSGRSYRWVWGIIALLVINGMLLVLLIGRDSDDDEAPVATRPDLAVPVQPQSRALNRALEKPRLPVRAPVAETVAPPAAVQPAAAVPPPLVVQPPTTVARPPDSVVPPVSVAEPLQSQAGATGVPAWEDLPLEFRSRFAMPRLDVHVYADEPRRRFIMVDLQKYREGDTLDNGALLEAILPGSIQLYYEGTRFLMEK